MLHPVLLPKLGPQAEAVTLVAWNKAEGDLVQKGEILYEVESSKVVNEIEAEHTGILTRIFLTEGTVVQPGAKVAEMDVADEASEEQAS